MINIMLCGNDNVYDGMLLAILSILKHTKEILNVYILTMDLTEKDERFKAISKENIEKIDKILKHKNENNKVFLIDATQIYKEEMLDGRNESTHYTPYIYLRLLSDRIKEIPDKVLYLDTDIIVYKDIKELYNIDIDNYEIAMARDFIGRKWINKDYLNSGVILMNLSKIRKQHDFEKCRQMCKTKKMVLPDQTALNRVLKNKLILEDKFNEQYKRKEDTVIRHFSMQLLYFPIIRPRNIKPWQIDKVHKILKINDYDDIYEEYLKAKEGE